MNIQQIAKNRFDEELQKTIPGFIHEVELINDVGDGFPTSGSSYRTRCEFYSRTDQKILRTSLDDPLSIGLIVFVPDLAGSLDQIGSDGFYMITKDPDQQPDCWKGFPEPMTHLITLNMTVPAKVDEYGFQLAPSTIKTMIKNIPVILHHNQSIQRGSDQPGTIVDDLVAVTMQRNRSSEQIQPGWWFRKDQNKYVIFDVISDVHGSGGGILQLLVKRETGSRFK